MGVGIDDGTIHKENKHPNHSEKEVVSAVSMGVLRPNSAENVVGASNDGTGKKR